MLTLVNILFGLSDYFFIDNKFRIMVLCVVDIQREEKSVQKAIKEAAKRNDMGSAKVLGNLVF